MLYLKRIHVMCSYSETITTLAKTIELNNRNKFISNISLRAWQGLHIIALMRFSTRNKYIYFAQLEIIKPWTEYIYDLFVLIRIDSFNDIFNGKHSYFFRVCFLHLRKCSTFSSLVKDFWNISENISSLRWRDDNSRRLNCTITITYLLTSS